MKSDMKPTERMDGDDERRKACREWRRVADDERQGWAMLFTSVTGPTAADRAQIAQREEDLLAAFVQAREQKAVNDAEALRAEVRRLEDGLQGLLARIFRDGGHYLAAHGMEYSLRQADTVVANYIGEAEEASAKLAGVTALKERAEAAEVDLKALRETDAEIMRDSERKTGEIDALRAKLALYEELLYAVGQKWPDETRHQTALRYIRERVSGCRLP